MFFTELVHRAPSQGVVYSPARKAWATPDSSGFKAHHWADGVEVQAVARLFGTHGIRLLEKPLLALITENVRQLRAAIDQNSAALQVLLLVYVIAPVLSTHTCPFVFRVYVYVCRILPNSTLSPVLNPLW